MMRSGDARRALYALEFAVGFLVSGLCNTWAWLCSIVLCMN